MDEWMAPEIFRKIFIEFMFGDIERGITSARANYLVALGLFSYIEVLGGLITGKGGKRGEGERNFNAAIKEFPQEYREIDSRLKVKTPEGIENGIYSIVRCGFVHEYGIKSPATVVSNPDGNIQPHIGIKIENDCVVVCNNELFRDFKSTVENISQRLQKSEQPLLQNVTRVFQRWWDYSLVIE